MRLLPILIYEDKLNAAGFLKDRFCIVWDFRTVRDHDVFNTGTPVEGTSGVQIKLMRRATTKDVICSVYIISECGLGMTQYDVQSINL